ncbi:MAG TPA: 2-amino-4-hydroxy-6-hydroxymethyldihydropteridine diphosphokinase [Thermoanaerobaculaceae bacterium]|nr:2-amino-4-hydroxy-6-hydroxymethyldihydropteridine diphosphokinase [Thermoanaerobaculaceae bacterium]
MRLLIGLGGNLGDVAHTFSHALATLRVHLHVVALSGLWRTAAHGPPQPDFLNAAVLVETTDHPLALLTLCHDLEIQAGRDPAHQQRWGPRPLDLDLLIAPGLVIEAPRLVLPHPRLTERRFALAPAAELAPDWLHPRLHLTLSQLAAAPEIASQRCDRIGPFPDV